MVDITSLVVSDNLATAASNRAVETAEEGDIGFTDWEGYLNHTFEQNVQVFDFNFFSRASEPSTGQPEISEHESEFKDFFERFPRILRLLLQTGDSVVILDGPEIPVVEKQYRGPQETVSSHRWMSELGLIDNKEYISNFVPVIETEADPAVHYLQAVTNHYSYELNPGVVRDPTLLATSPETGSPAAFATSEIMNKNGKTTEVDGNLVILPPPTAFTKPMELMRSLVNTAWYFHEDDRTNQIKDNQSEDKTTLAIPMSELDDELIEKCWSKYARGEYRDAASRACQHLEHRVRDSVGGENGDRSGSDLMKHAFSPEDGPLSMGEQPGEKEGVMHMYAGAIQGVWNPLHHRPSGENGENYLDEFGEQKAHDILSYVNFLLSLLPEESSD